MQLRFAYVPLQRWRRLSLHLVVWEIVSMTGRQQWLKNGQNGTGIKTPEMVKIDSEMSRRSAIKWQNDPKRSRDKNYRWTDANRWEKD